MKIQALLIAVTLAAGSAFAAAPNADAKADAAATAAAPDAAAPATTPVKKSHKKAAKKKHASAGTQAMGAGPAAPMTDLQAASRQARVDQAYSNWQAKQR